MPIWLSPPVKISKLGVIQKIIMSIYDDDGGMNKGLIDGSLISRSYITPNQYAIFLTGNQLRLIGSSGTKVTSGGDGFYTGANAPTNLDPFDTFGPPLNWQILLNQYGKVQNGTSQVRLKQANGNEVVGTISVSPLDETILVFNIDSDTIPSNTVSLPNVTKIINPLTFTPPSNLANGTRYLLINDLGDSSNTFDASAWGNFHARANDVIQYNSSSNSWSIVFDASDPDSTEHYLTNLNTGIQYKFNGSEWIKSYEGVYTAGNWSIMLDGNSSDYDASQDTP